MAFLSKVESIWEASILFLLPQTSTDILKSLIPQSRVNFTNILRAAFARKRYKTQVQAPESCSQDVGEIDTTGINRRHSLCATEYWKNRRKKGISEWAPKMNMSLHCRWLWASVRESVRATRRRSISPMFYAQLLRHQSCASKVQA